MIKFSKLFGLLFVFSLQAQELDTAMLDEPLADEVSAELEDWDLPESFDKDSEGVGGFRAPLNFGSTGLIFPRRAVGLSAGLETVSTVALLRLAPTLNLLFGDFSTELAVPFRFPIYDASGISGPLDIFSGFVPFKEFVKPRPADWDEAKDFTRVLRRITYGEEHDPLYINFGRKKSVTLAHGQIMRTYAPNINFDEDHLFAHGKFDFEVAGGELAFGPVFSPRIMGISIFGRPLWNSGYSSFLRELKPYISVVSDFKAPRRLVKARHKDSESLYAALAKGNLLLSEQGAVTGLSLGLASYPVKTDFIALETFVEWTGLFFPKVNDLFLEIDSPGFSGGALSFGALIELPFFATGETGDTDPVHVFRAKAVGRGYSAQYLPHYFDTLYEAQKYQFGTLADVNDAFSSPTKVGYLATNKGQAFRLGYTLSATYEWVKHIALGFVYDDAYVVDTFMPDGKGRKLMLHLESTGLSSMQFLAAFHSSHFANFSELFDFENQSGLVFLQGRFKILPFLFLDASAQYSFLKRHRPKNEGERARLVQASDEKLADNYSDTGLSGAWTMGLSAMLEFGF